METTELDISTEGRLGRSGAVSSIEEEGEAIGHDPGRVVEYIVAETSLGMTLVGVTRTGVCAVLLGDDKAGLEADLAERFPGRRLREGDEPGPWVGQVLACVDGRASDSGEVPVDLKGTDFQKTVWSALREIRVGTTATYAGIATRIGRPSSVRAVARACGANPLAVIVPCHRVLRGDGSISGYRWGVERKRLLLDRETGEQHSVSPMQATGSSPPGGR